MRVPLSSRTDAAGLAWHAVDTVSRAAATLAGVDLARVQVSAEPLGPAHSPDPTRIAIAYTSERWFRWNRETPAAFAPLSGFFPTADGWVRTHANYPHHAAALRRALGLPSVAAGDPADDVAALTLALSRITARDASDAVTRAGGLCVVVGPEDAAGDAHLRETSLVESVRLGGAPPRPAGGGNPEAPLRGIRVLDLTRVIAGPVATRTLALLGADVLRVDPPQLPEIAWQHLDTGHGKRSTLLDLTRTADHDRFDALLATADIVALGYRPAALKRLGLDPATLAERRPGLIVIQHSAWGDDERRGLDSLVQAASGIAWVESSDGARPGALPAQALDHSTGYLLAAAALDLLRRRADEGGSWLVRTSLRRMAAELLGRPRTSDPAAAVTFDPTPHLQSFDVDGVEVTTTAPAPAYPGGPTAFAPPRPWAGDAPHWVN